MNYWNEKLKIGKNLYPRFLGGPLDGYTDSPWRRLVREFSPENLLYTEMRHVSCVAHENGALKALNFEQAERPLNFQVTLNALTVDHIEAVIERVEEAGVDVIDINIACPARNVVKSQSGSALMADKVLLEQILRRMKAAATVPLTVKMRAGFKEKNALEVVKLVEDCGFAAIAIHPRLQSAKFSGEPDYSLVADIKQSISIPLLYSGGIHTFEDAQHVYERTGVDGFLIGRGMFGKPWKLAELQAQIDGREHALSLEQQITIALRHLNFIVDYYGEDGVYAFRKHLASYIAGFENASRVREELIRVDSCEELEKKLRLLCRNEERA